MSEDSIIQFYKNPERYLYQSLEIESQFEKPYNHDSYRSRHLDLPRQEWPSYEPGAVGSVGGGGWNTQVEDADDGECGPCVIFTPNTPSQDDCSDGLNWLVAQVCTHYGPSEVLPDVTLTITDYLGDIESHGPGIISGDMSGTIYFGPESGDHMIGIEMVDGAHNICSAMSPRFTCSQGCPPLTAISWDDSTSAETIARSDSCAIAVLDGTPPYHWIISGTGFSLTYSHTDGTINELNADNTACGICTITVTDVCGGTVTDYIRCTTGTWAHKSAYDDTCVETGSGYWEENVGSYAARHYNDNGYFRQEQVTNWEWEKTSPVGTTACLYESTGYWDGYDTVQEECAVIVAANCPNVGVEDCVIDSIYNYWLSRDNVWCSFALDNPPNMGANNVCRCVCIDSLKYYEWECV